MCTIAPVQFGSFLSHFRADNPGIEITLLEAVPDQLCDQLVKGEMDVALWLARTAFRRLFRLRNSIQSGLLIACSTGHRFAMKNEIRMAELDGEIYFSRD